MCYNLDKRGNKMARPYLHDVNFDSSPGMHSSADKRLELLEQIKALKEANTSLINTNRQVLKSDSEVYQEILTAAQQFVQCPADETEKALADTLEKYNLLLYSYRYTPTSKDKRDVARMAFNGYVDRPEEYLLSPILRDMKNNPLKRAKTKPDDYDLSHSTVWNVFKQIPEFAATEEKVKKGLSLYGIPPEKLAELQLKDFCFILNDQYRSSGKDSAKVFPESYKARHTKRFISEYEDEFRQGLMSMEGVQKEYVDALVSAMKNGITDLTKTPLWKDEWRNQPVIDVHHIVNIKDSSLKETDNKSFAHINDYENMCFIVRHPQHDAMHALEQDLNQKHREDIFYNRDIEQSFIYRIQPPEGVKCMIGFHTFIYDRDVLGLEQKPKQQLIDQKRKDPNYYKNQHGRREALRKEGKHRGFYGRNYI